MHHVCEAQRGAHVATAQASGRTMMGEARTAVTRKRRMWGLVDPGEESGFYFE